MKGIILASLLLSLNAQAAFSDKIIGQKSESSIVDKDFTNNNIQNLHRKKQELVLTFDDGPTPGVTDKILDVLKENNVKATFFVIASKAQKSPYLMRRMAEEGHIIANHTTNHPNLNKAGTFQWKKMARTEIIGAHEILSLYTANNDKFYFRAPEGAWNSKIARFLNEEFYAASSYRGPILWDIGGNVNYDKNNEIYEAADWACWAKKMTVSECLKGYLVDTTRKQGGVVLFHDLRTSSVELTRQYIQETLNLGYNFVNLDSVKLD